jgi:pentatricopeptide repeat protein
MILGWRGLLKLPSNSYTTAAVAIVPFLLVFKYPFAVSLAMQLPTKISPPSRSIHNDNKAQALLWTRQMRACGSNIPQCLELLQTITSVSCVTRDDTETSAINNYELYESAYFEALAVVSRAKRSNDASINSHRYIQKIVLQLYEQCPTDSCRARAISICNLGGSSRHSNSDIKQSLDIALQLLQTGVQPPSVQSYHAALAVCVTAKDWEQALHVVRNQMTGRIATTLSWNIVFTAMFRAKQGSEAHQLLKQMIDHQYQRPCHTTFPPPDRNTFHFTMNALIATDNTTLDTISDRNNETSLCAYTDTAYSLLNTMLLLDQWYATNITHPSNLSVLPNDATFDLLLSAYSRKGAWDMISFINNVRIMYEKKDQNFTFPNIPTDIRCSKVSWDQYPTNAPPIRIRWENEGMVKMNTEKYWKIGTYHDPIVPYNFTVALQPHRNPSKNGIKLLLYNNIDGSTLDGSCDSRNCTKVGFLLMVNRMPCQQESTTVVGTSSLLGVYLNPIFRRSGLSKIIIAIWLDLCRRACAAPRTGVINKPLLALVLQHTFQFVPESKKPTNHGLASTDSGSSSGGGGGVTIEICPGLNSTIGLYSSNLKCLHGAFSVRDVRRENIIMLQDAPTPRGRLCRIGTTFSRQSTCTIARKDNDPAGCTIGSDDIVTEQLLGKTQTGTLKYDRLDLCWRQVFFGDTAEKKT